MGKIVDAITEKQKAFIARQQMYFVATAPQDLSGRINLSPKGLDSFRVLGPKRVAYLDLTGSGNETAAHLNENGRITLMFCAFEGAPNILRIYGKGKAVLPESAAWHALRAAFPEMPGVRQIFDIVVEGVQDSCGFGIPRMVYQEERTELTKWADKMGPEKLAKYREEKNAISIDGLRVPLRKS